MFRPNASDVGWLVSRLCPRPHQRAAAPPANAAEDQDSLQGAGQPPLQPTLELSFVTTPPNEGVRAKLTGGLNRTSAIDGPDFALKIDGHRDSRRLRAEGAWPKAPRLPTPTWRRGSRCSRKKADGKALVIGPFEGATLSIGELGVGVRLKKGGPRLDMFARKGKATPRHLRDVPEGGAVRQRVGRFRHRGRGRCQGQDPA